MAADGLGLDGRNRVAACKLADVEPRWEVYEGDAVSFIVEVNGDRRHLTTGQRAMAVAIGLVESGARSNGRFKRGSVPGVDNPGARVRKTWTDAVRQAGLVHDHTPELADEVLGGAMALDAAHKIASDTKRRKERLTDLDSELATLVGEGVVTLDEAEARQETHRRIGELPDDLADRVRDGGLSLDEAEVIARENAQRLDAYAESVREWLDGLGRMVGYPLSDGLRARLTPEEIKTLSAALTAMGKVTK
jgi:hypothetical protein